MRSLFSAYACLLIAVVVEVIGTTLLARSGQFTRLAPTLGVFVTYGLSFYLLSLALETLPLAVAYALWAGIGIVLTTLAGSIVLGQAIDLPAIAGIVLIAAGVILINGWSGTVTH